MDVVIADWNLKLNYFITKQDYTISHNSVISDTLEKVELKLAVCRFFFKFLSDISDNVV